MTTFVLIPGAGGSSWYWHLVQPLLEGAGHTVIAPDLPAGDDSAGLGRYADIVVEALGAAGAAGSTGAAADVIVVGQSMGGLVAPLVADRIGASLLVLVAAMIPQPGERGGQWWEATGQGPAARAAARAEGRDPTALDDPITIFLHDLPSEVLAEALERPVEQSDAPFHDPWPLPRWPDVATRVIAARHDRLFPLDFMQRLARNRLGIEPDIIDTGHLPALADPAALAALLIGYEAQRPGSGRPGSGGHG